MNTSIRVLLVDDEVDFVETLAERLELRDLQPTVALNGEAALENISKNDFDVVVLDLKMPGMSGLEVLRQIRRRQPDLPVIMLTGHGSEMEHDEAVAIGAWSYLQKPIEIDSLIKLFHKAVSFGSQSSD